MNHSFKLTTYNKNPLSKYKFKTGESIFIRTEVKFSDVQYPIPALFSQFKLFLSLRTSFGNIELKNIELTNTALLDSENNIINSIYKYGANEVEIHSVITQDEIDTYFDDLSLDNLDKEISIDYHLTCKATLNTKKHTVLDCGRFFIYKDCI